MILNRGLAKLVRHGILIPARNGSSPLTPSIFMAYKNKADQLANQRKHYALNKEKYKGRSRKRNKEQIEINRKYVWEFLKTHPCIDCGESDPIVLEFDHRDRTSKKTEISRLTGGAYSLEVVISEISKCDVRCSNCHKRRTAVQFGYYKDLF